MSLSLLLSAVLAAFVAAPAPGPAAAPAPAPAPQVSFSVNIGGPPVCPYGYFPYRPYNCAPWGYYGPAWFQNGIFIGAGPWFHGGPGFHGWVNRGYDPRYGFRGPLPHRGEHGQWDRDHFRGHPDWNHFHGSEMRDGRGNAWHGDHGQQRGGHGYDHGDHGHDHGDHGHDHGDHGNGH
jgi:hypothetical protein